MSLPSYPPVACDVLARSWANTNTHALQCASRQNAYHSMFIPLISRMRQFQTFLNTQHFYFPSLITVALKSAPPMPRTVFGAPMPYSMQPMHRHDRMQLVRVWLTRPDNRAAKILLQWALSVGFCGFFSRVQSRITHNRMGNVSTCLDVVLRG